MRKLLLISVFAGTLLAQGPQALGVVELDSVTAEPADAAVDLPEPLSVKERFKWAAVNAVSARRFAGAVISSALATASNAPREYGPHWDGFGKRLGMRASTGATGLMLEASIGALWREDPRYVRAAGPHLKGRLFNVVKMSFMAYNADGELKPAYARYIAVPANSFISNAWRADSHATVERATMRIPLAFLDRMIANSFSEFWPELIKPLRRGK